MDSYINSKGGAGELVCLRRTFDSLAYAVGIGKARAQNLASSLGWGNKREYDLKPGS